MILKLESILAGEYAENEFRKQFTKSERAEIGKAIEEELGKTERRGILNEAQMRLIGKTKEKPSISPPRRLRTTLISGCMLLLIAYA